MNLRDVPDKDWYAENRRRERERDEAYRKACDDKHRLLVEHQTALLRGKIRDALGVEPDSGQLDDIICAVYEYNEATS